MNGARVVAVENGRARATLQVDVQPQRFPISDGDAVEYFCLRAATVHR